MPKEPSSLFKGQPAFRELKDHLAVVAATREVICRAPCPGKKSQALGMAAMWNAGLHPDDHSPTEG